MKDANMRAIRRKKIDEFVDLREPTARRRPKHLDIYSSGHLVIWSLIDGLVDWWNPTIK
jgi:hypothetical protein